MNIRYSSKFIRRYQKLPEAIKLRAEKAENLFRKNPFDPSLHTHKLTGSFKEFWAFSLDYRYRIIFEFYGKNVVWFHSVGDHDIYK